MKKTLLILVLALAALSACRKSGPAEEPVAATYDLSQLSFHFTVQYPTETKAVKSGWTEGDKIFIFFSGVDTQHYLTLSYDGSAWATPTVQPGEGSPALDPTGLLTAIYLPYGNSATPTYSDSRWSFGDVADSYFLQAEKVAYQILDTGNAMSTLNAVLYMEMPAGYAQFFIPDAEAAAPVQLACNLMKPGGLIGIDLDGTVAENTSGAEGGWITGYNATVGDAKGYYVSGKPIADPGLDCYFIFKSGVNYKHYYKPRLTPIAVRGAYKLPALSSWTAVSSSEYVTLGGYLWKVVNEGASLPWAPGEPAASNARTAVVPTDAVWNALLGGANIRWIPMAVAGQAGSLVVEEYETSQFRYIFLPRVDYWSLSETHFLHFDESGVAAISTGVAPENVYIRQIKDIYHGGFNPPESGGNI